LVLNNAALSGSLVESEIRLDRERETAETLSRLSDACHMGLIDEASRQASSYSDPKLCYTGQRFDPETGLYYYRARYYSAALGRFLQTDPIGYKDDLDWYTYVGNDPTDKTDPTGLAVSDINPQVAPPTAPDSSDDQTSARLVSNQRQVAVSPLTTRPQPLESRGRAPGKGERGQTRSPSGTGNPDKHVKPAPRPGYKIVKNPHSGKSVEKPWPEDPRLSNNSSQEMSTSAKAGVAAGAVGVTGLVVLIVVAPEFGVPAAALTFAGAAAQ